MTAELQPRWFVAHTHPHAEAKATAHLNRQGFEIYFPRYLKRRRHARRVETVAAPLFPSYLFVALDVSVEGWRAIQSTIGVAYLITCGDRRAIQSTIGVAYLITCGDSPVRVADEVIEAIQAREDARGHVTMDC